MGMGLCPTRASRAREPRYDLQTDMTLVREPVWGHLREHCNSFSSMSTNAVFSDTFRLNTVGAMTELELKSLFLIQQSNQSVCSFCSNVFVKETDVFILYLTFANLLQNQFENYVSYQIVLHFTVIYFNSILGIFHCCNIL